MQLEPRPITGFFRCSYVLVSSTWQVNHFNLFWYKTELTNLCNIISLKKNVLSFMDTKWKLLTFGQILCWHLSHRNMPLPCFPSCITWPATRMVSAFCIQSLMARFCRFEWRFTSICSVCRCGGPGVLWNDGVSTEGH